ncbi:MAG: site-specific integrase [Bacteroides sp.]|jgi:site-specific recombinase XerD|nr:site-specific integrase [Bacteroides sp.]
MASIKITLDKRRKKQNGEYPIRISLSHRGDHERIDLGISALEDQYENGQLNKQATAYQSKNIKIRNSLSIAERTILELAERTNIKNIPINKIKDKIDEAINGKRSGKVFVDYMDDFIALKTKEGTKSVYEQTKVKILRYDPYCTFESMDKAWLTSFENWMSETMKINAYAIHLRNIRAIFNYAIDEEIITVYPFRKFKIKKEETSKRSLTREQLITLRDYPCEEYQRRYRDIFMLMFYLIGINAADLFTAKRIINNRLEYHRAKTNKLYSIKIEPEAMEIINRYHGNDYLLNVLDEYKDYKDFLHRMGIALKQIGECKRVGRGGKKVITPLFPDISSYWSRHTWASIAAELDIPKETIAAALGHSQNSVTDIYINFDKKKIDEANRLVIDSLK